PALRDRVKRAIGLVVIGIQPGPGLCFEASFHLMGVPDVWPTRRQATTAPGRPIAEKHSIGVVRIPSGYRAAPPRSRPAAVRVAAAAETCPGTSGSWLRRLRQPFQS